MLCHLRLVCIVPLCRWRAAYLHWDHCCWEVMMRFSKTLVSHVLIYLMDPLIGFRCSLTTVWFSSSYHYWGEFDAQQRKGYICMFDQNPHFNVPICIAQMVDMQRISLALSSSSWLRRSLRLLKRHIDWLKGQICNLCSQSLHEKYNASHSDFWTLSGPLVVHILDSTISFCPVSSAGMCGHYNGHRNESLQIRHK